MDPASTIIEKIGGFEVAAKVAKTAATTPYGWTKPREKGGTNGLIPQKYHPAILAYAKENGIRLKAEDFLPRRSAA